MATTSFLYSSSFKLKEVRRVSVDKRFNLTITLSSMNFLHKQFERTTLSMLDSPFLFVEDHDSNKPAHAYCLSFFSDHDEAATNASEDDLGTPASQASTTVASTNNCQVPSTRDLGCRGRMVKLQCQEGKDAFVKFKSSPLIVPVDDDGEGVRVVVPIYCTIATYQACFGNADRFVHVLVLLFHVFLFFLSYPIIISKGCQNVPG